VLRDSVIWIHSVRYRIPFLSLKTLGLGPVCMSQSGQHVNHMHRSSNEGTSDSNSTLPTTYSPYLLSAAERILRLLSNSSYVISIDWSTPGRSPGHISRKLWGCGWACVDMG
jgi:hypothetical protein